MPLLEDLYNKQRAKQLELDDYIYSVTINTINAGTTVPGSLTIDADSDFVARFINVTAWTAGPVLLTAAIPLLISIADTGSGRNLQNQPLPLTNIAGGVALNTGFLPGILPEPKLFVGSATITVTLQNITAATNITRCDVSFVGNKVFYFGQYKRG